LDKITLHVASQGIQAPANTHPSHTVKQHQFILATPIRPPDARLSDLSINQFVHLDYFALYPISLPSPFRHHSHRRLDESPTHHLCFEHTRSVNDSCTKQPAIHSSESCRG
jgi:hypothetical protein